MEKIENYMINANKKEKSNNFTRFTFLSPPQTHSPSLRPTVSDIAPASLIEDEQSEAGIHVSEEMYWQRYYNHLDFNYEWNDGVLEVKPVADFAKAQIYLWFLHLLKHYLNVYPLADIIVLEIGFRLNLQHKTTIRKPDLGLILHSNQTLMAPSDRTYKGVFDLCIESLSDSTQAEKERDIIAKKQEYEAVGVQEYYILDDQRTHTIFYERTANGVYQPIQAQAGGVIASRMLAGFQFRIEDLYRQPSWQDLVEDVVYQGFVLPEYLAERERADQERQRADQAVQAVETAKATTLTLLRQSLAHRFDLPLNYYDDTLFTLDPPALAALSEQVFAVADQTDFEALLKR